MSDDPAPERFLRLYTRHQHAVLSFLLGAAGNLTDAEDLLQDVAVVLLRKFDQYDAQRSFVAWAVGVAKLEVAKHRRKSRQRTPLLAPDVLEGLATAWDRDELVLREARDRLADCVQKLDPKERKLLSQRYRDGLTPTQLAKRWRKPAGAINARLVRIRKALLTCTHVSPRGTNA